VIIRVPGSSANLGPGFDTLGLAVGRYAEAGTDADAMPDGASLVDEHHPAAKAFRLAGGVGPLWLRSRLPMGRGLGYSGAVRVAGILAGRLHSSGRGEITADDRSAAVELGAELEGHPDNVAASVYGGVVASAGGFVVPVPLAVTPGLVVWVPPFTTSTDSSRSRLPEVVTYADAVFNVGRTALLVAALATGRTDALRAATADRLHQDRRLGAAEPSRTAIEAALGAGAWCAWLSGSGPTVAAFCDPADTARVAASLPPDGVAHVLEIDTAGAMVVRPS